MFVGTLKEKFDQLLGYGSDGMLYTYKDAQREGKIPAAKAVNMIGKICEFKTIAALSLALTCLEDVFKDAPMAVDHNSQYNPRNWSFKEIPNNDGADITVEVCGVVIEIEVKHRKSGYTTKKEFAARVAPKFSRRAVKILVLYTGYGKEEVEKVREMCERRGITLIEEAPVPYERMGDEYAFTEETWQWAWELTSLEGKLERALRGALVRSVLPSSCTYTSYIYDAYCLTLRDPIMSSSHVTDLLTDLCPDIISFSKATDPVLNINVRHNVNRHSIRHIDDISDMSSIHRIVNPRKTCDKTDDKDAFDFIDDLELKLYYKIILYGPEEAVGC